MKYLWEVEYEIKSTDGGHTYGGERAFIGGGDVASVMAKARKRGEKEAREARDNSLEEKGYYSRIVSIVRQKRVDG